jgi:ABC-type lipoprotein export system ATPase subunit
MITEIRLNKVTPNIFVGSPPEGGPTELWDKDVSFRKGTSYLDEASSGRGKSSFCSFIYGLRSDYSGTIEWIGDDGNTLVMTEAAKCHIRKHSIAMMFQEHRIFPELTAVENVMLKNLLTNFYTEREIRAMLSLLGLRERLDTPCARLSFGQQQRVAFVRTLSQPADFILLDEPISHLDAENAAIMGEILKKREDSDNVGIIVTSIGNRLDYPYKKIIKL